MRRLRPMGTAAAVLFLVLAFDFPIVAQHPTPVLRDQPDSPLEIVSMQPTATPARPNVPAKVLERMADYIVVARNRTDVPIMAYAFRHESSFQGKIASTCQSSMGFKEPMIGAGETKTIQSNLQKHGPTITPVVDLVLLRDGTYYGADTCGKLGEYTTRLEERRSLFRIILHRLDKDGADKTKAWMKEELSLDVSALMAPQKKK